MKRYLWKHLWLGLGYGAIILGLSLLKGGGGSFFWQRFCLFELGVIVGVWLLFLDRLVYVYMYPHEQLSQQVRYWWQKKRYKQALDLVDARRTEQQRLVFRSALFMGIWVILGLFSITSTSSWFGKGVVMGLMWHILVDAWRWQRRDKEQLNKRLFWQIKRVVSQEEQLVFLGGISLVFGLLSLWLEI